MPTFEVEVIHEPSGAYMSFEVELEDEYSNEPITEDDAWRYIMDDLSIITHLVEEQ